MKENTDKLNINKIKKFCSLKDAIKSQSKRKYFQITYLLKDLYLCIKILKTQYENKQPIFKRGRKFEHFIKDVQMANKHMKDAQSTSLVIQEV